MNFTKDFEEILVGFFKKYDEKNLNLVPDIMRRFRQDKRDVIMHLCSRYNVDINSIEGVEADMATGPANRPKPVAENTEGGSGVESPEDTSNEELAPPEKKSKKKLFLIIGVIVLIAVLVGGYFMFMGGDKKPATTEEPAATEEPISEETETEPETEPEPEPVLDTAIADSAQTDSTTIDTSNAAAESANQEETE